MARNGPRDDFHNQRTQHANYGAAGAPPSGEPPPAGPPDQSDRFGQPESVDYFAEEAEPTPWYRRPVLLIGWFVFVLILIALIIYGIIELIHGNQGIGHSPATTTTTTIGTTTTTTPPPTTTATTPPTSSSAAEPPPQPTHQPTRQPTQQQPTHRHHLPELPSVITIPGVPTVITVPPGLR